MRAARLFLFAALVPIVLSRPHAAAAPPAFPNESLNYSIDWPSGLSLGELHWKATNSGSASAPNWSFALDVEAHAPGFSLIDSYQASPLGNFCAGELTRDLHHGAKSSADSVVVDTAAKTAKRKTANGGGESTFTVPDCVRDALTFVFFARQELASGRLPAEQTVLFGGPYDVTLTLLGSGPVKAGDRAYDVDRIGCAIRGPASSLSAEIDFARDAVRTPVLIKIPLSLGSFSVELLH